MNKSVYIIPVNTHSGKSVVSLGVLQMIMRNTSKVGYFKPIIESKSEKDMLIETVLEHFKLNMSYEETYAYTRKEVIALKNQGNIGEVYDTIIKKYKALEEKFDFVLVDSPGIVGDSNFDTDFNASVAQSLNIPVLVVLKDSFASEDELLNQVQVQLNSILEKDVQVLSVFINKAKNATEATQSKLEQKFKDITFTVIPRKEELSRPTIREVAKALNAEFLYKGDNIDVITKRTLIGAMQLPNYFANLTEDTLAVIPADRTDLITGSLVANYSNYSNIKGIVLYGDFELDKSIHKILEGIQKNIPIMIAKSNTFETANLIGAINPRIYPENTEKIKLLLQLFDETVDAEKLNKSISSFKSETITPRMFQYNMVQKARQGQKHIVLPEGTDDRILTAASQLAEDELVYLTILGDPEAIKTRATNILGLKWNEKRISIVNPANSPKYEAYAEKLYELRKSKGLELSQAKDLMLDASYFGTMMVFVGDADGMVSGAVNTTAHTIRPSLQFVKTKPGVSTVSSVFFMLLHDRVLVYGDCAVVPNPTAEQLADIAISSADSAIAFGIEPKVALLSYSSGNSGSGADVDKVREATALVKQRRPELLVEGPIQYDAAVDPKVGKQKMPNSPVAGQANVLIFPDLNTGNNTYKAVQRETGGLAIGPMLQGLKKPVNDLSRGALIPDIYNTVLITAIQSEF
ncbi:phosphate acetyltransferase [Capnocytophaga sp. oral taxon 332 str. F0381]|jgi:phosphate acetyltransferase|uniref:phosphate acetyltransferase n=1 Tax=Capnocytophaga TaxID=1016 RepID=UPI0002A3096A|nr:MULTISPECIES: phosphate acetyltransferase [Capnocytophaga]EKY07480.1 phosphate acetyltransferase [Capnocytophaga sp. oral taxon 332 str. F0381]